MGSLPLRTRRIEAPRVLNGGFNLIELMIAITLEMVLILIILGSMSAASSMNRSNGRTTELQTNGQFALEILRRDVLHAGLKGFTYARPDTGTPGAITSECAVGFVANVGMGIWGADDTNPFSGTCIPAANYATGDILVLRRAGFVPATTLAANAIYLRSAYERGQVFRGNAPPTFTELPVQDYPVESFVYYISPYTNSPTESPQIPALYRVVLSPGPTMSTAELVATGIENFQVQYGRLLTDGTTRYYDANQVSTASSTVTIASEWDEIHAVRIWLLARTGTGEPGYTNHNTYQMGNQSVTVNDGFRRQLYTSVIMLRNNRT